MKKHLVYILKDSLYVVNPENFNDVKRYGMTIQPHAIFFTKENIDWVLNIKGWNDYKFPVVKKYSLSKLSTQDTRRKRKNVVVNNNAQLP